MIEQFWLFHCGWFRAPRGALEKGGGFDLVRCPFLCAVAVHPTYGPIVVDAPFGHEGPANAGEVFGSFLRRAGQRFQSQWATVKRIEQLGFRPAEVDHILMTHLHWDHTGGMKGLAHATFHVTGEEWDHAIALSPVEALRSGYAQADFRALSGRLRRLDIPDTPGDGLDVFGDGSVEAVALPGHSPGHAGYRFRLANGRVVFFIGDAVFSIPQITEDAEFGIFPRLVAHSTERTRATRQRLREAWRSAPDAEILVCSHDFGWGERCIDGPIALHEL